MSNEDKNEVPSNFLMYEYEALQHRANSHEEIKAKRVNFFLVVIAATGAIFSAVLNDATLKVHAVEIALSLSLFALILGLSTLKSLISYSIAIVVFYRRSARIRKWFVDKYDGLEPYVAFEANDDRPTFTIKKSLLYWRGAETILLLLNSFATFIVSGCSMLIFSIPNSVTLIIAISFALISWFGQLYLSEYLLKKAETSEWAEDNINFPTRA